MFFHPFVSLSKGSHGDRGLGKKFKLELSDLRMLYVTSRMFTRRSSDGMMQNSPLSFSRETSIARAATNIIDRHHL